MLLPRREAPYKTNAQNGWIAAFWWAAAILALTGCGSKPEAVDAKTVESPKPAPVRTGPNALVVLDPQAPELRQISIEPIRAIPIPADEISAPAKIEANPNRVSHALLPVPGRIVQVLVRLGDSVVQGQPVVTIESPAVAEAAAAMISAEALLRQAKVGATKAEADLARVTDLFEHQAVARKEVLAAETAASLSKSTVEQAESARQQAKRRLELLGLKSGNYQQHVSVAAPVSGKVLEISAVDGEFRNEINAPLLTIADLSRVWATSEVAESKIRFCKVGGTAELELIAYPKESFHARVTRIADIVNSETRTVKVNAEIENSGGRLRPEMFGSMRFAQGVVDTPWVPDSAVVRSADKDLVFVEEAPGRFRAAQVQLGKHFGNGVALTGGAKAGDRIVTRGSVYLKASL